MAGLCVLFVRSAQPQTRARRRRLSSLWSRSILTPPTKAAASLVAAEMGPAARRELALGLRSAEVSLAATRGRSRWRWGGAGARETQRRRLPSALGALDLLSRLGPRARRAETASMLRRSLPFLPTLLAISSSNARALPTSPPARLAGRRPSPADLAGQAVRLRGLPQASPQVCKGVAYCSKDCQVCVASHPACALSRPLAQENASMIRPHAQHEGMRALLDKARARMLMLAQGCESLRLLLTRVCSMCALPLTRSLTHTAPSHHELIHQNVRLPKPETLHPKHQPLHFKPGTRNPKA